MRTQLAFLSLVRPLRTTAPGAAAAVSTTAFAASAVGGSGVSGFALGPALGSMPGSRKRSRAVSDLRCAARSPKEPSGILIVNKPQNWTSFDVVNKVRATLEKYLRQHEAPTAASPPAGVGKSSSGSGAGRRSRRFRLRVGHGGTLDPLASGVLVLAVGAQYTRQLWEFQRGRKQYRATFKLGSATDTQDCTGEVIARSSFEHLREYDVEALNRLLQSEAFHGAIVQRVPAFSAVRVQGERLYDLARAGKADAIGELPSRTVYVFEARCEAFDARQGTGTLFVDCSGGTYIRTYIDDLGKALGTHAHMTSLVRLRVGPYALDDVSMPCLQTEKELSNPEKILSCLQAVSLTAPQPASSPVAKPPSSAA